MRTQRIIVMAALVAIFAMGCQHRGPKYRPLIDPEMARLTKEQAFDQGEQFFGRHRYARARSFYQHVYENYPNDPLGRRSLLRIADTYFAQSDPVNLVEAQYKYRDFINRYPGADSADYALLQIAMVSYRQMERPDRDQQKTHEAVEKFNDVIRTFPKSPLRPEAEKHLAEVMDRLGRHEHLVAKFYIKRGSYDAAVRRLNTLIDQFPNYTQRDAAFYDIGTSLDKLGRKGEARLYFERVVTEFPKSEYADKAKKQLASMKTA